MSFKKNLKSISDIRASNNLLWMKIVEIALKKAPKQTKAVMNEIRLNDIMITDIVDRIAHED